MEQKVLQILWKNAIYDDEFSIWEYNDKQLNKAACEIVKLFAIPELQREQLAKDILKVKK